MFFHGISLAFIEGIGGPELMLIMFIVLLLFGANRLPELARGMGKSIREFKKAAASVEDEIKNAMAEPPKPEKPALPASPTVTDPTTPPPSTPPTEPYSSPDQPTD